MFPILLAQTNTNPPPPVVLFTTLDGSLQSLFNAFLEPSIDNLTGALQEIALLGATLYLLFLGITILLGADGTPIYTALRTTAKIAFVGGISLSASGYQSVVVGTLKSVESGLVSTMHLAQATSASGDTESPKGIAEFLDSTMGIGFNHAKECFELGIDQGILSPGFALAWIFLGLIFGLATAALVIVGGAMVILSQFAVVILFALGPLFVLCLMFPQTEGFFYRWMGEVLSFVFQNVIISVILAFALAQFESFAKDAVLQGDDVMAPLVAGLQVFVVALVMVYLLVKSGPMGAALSGGMSASSISPQGALQTAGAMLSGAAGAVSKGASLARSGAGAVRKLDQLGSAPKPVSPAAQRAVSGAGSPGGSPTSPVGGGTNIVVAYSGGPSSGGSPSSSASNAAKNAAQAPSSSGATTSSSSTQESAEAPKRSLKPHQTKAIARFAAGESSAPSKVKPTTDLGRSPSSRSSAPKPKEPLASGKVPPKSK